MRFLILTGCLLMTAGCIKGPGSDPSLEERAYNRALGECQMESLRLPAVGDATTSQGGLVNGQRQGHFVEACMRTRGYF